MVEQSLDKPRFRRDYYTLYLYLLSVVCGFHQAVLGSVTPFLRDELHLTRTAIGWHFSLYALGLFTTGFIVTWCARRLAPRTILLTTTGLVALVVALFALPLTPALTLVMSLVLGLVGGAMQIAIQESLARHHGEHSGVAITEGCVFAAIGVFAGPLFVSLAVEAGLGWRMAMVVPLIALLPLSLMVPKTLPRTPVAASSSDSEGRATARRLPLAAFLMFGMIFLGISAEWGIGFWGAQFLEERLTVPAATGVALMSVYFGGTIAGRIAVSRLLLRFEISTILIWAIVLGGIGLVALWLLPWLAAAAVALAIAGACLGNFFPLILSIATRQPPEFLSRISAGATQSVGLALLLAPLLLGSIGDKAGLVNAVGLLAIVPPVMLVVFLLSRRMH
ncbi:MFS transporter [Enterobacteriaceae bacterium 4M9]|nr:MFS transporter [Enterobacteriaceae bacterium 4M9]